MTELQKDKSNVIESQFKEHYIFLCLVAFYIVKDRDVAKDVVQDFFISYWKKRDIVSFSTSFKAYATKSIKNLSLQYIEKVKKENKQLDSLNIQDFNELETTLHKNTTEIKLNKLLDQLPEVRKKIFISAIVHGQSYKDIAKDNNISVNTVKTQIKRAYAFLRDKTKYEEILILISSFFIK